MLINVEAFIAEYDLENADANADGIDSYPETEVAVILATTWKEKRAELSLHRSQGGQGVSQNRSGIIEKAQQVQQVRQNRTLGSRMSPAS